MPPVELAWLTKEAVDTEGHGYTRVLFFAIGVKSLAFLLGLTYIVVDYKALGKGMTLTLKHREAREKEINDPTADPLTRRQHLRSITYAGLGLLASIIITAWVVFIRYLL